jgi:hypothetical protein
MPEMFPELGATITALALFELAGAPSIKTVIALPAEGGTTPDIVHVPPEVVVDWPCLVSFIATATVLPSAQLVD